VAKRRSATSPKQTGRSATRSYSKHAASLLSQRDALMAEIAILRLRAKAPRPSINKVGTLLTRYWSKANWQTREEILRAARWLLYVGNLQPPADATQAR
jgi:hypothetical protein